MLELSGCGEEKDKKREASESKTGSSNFGASLLKMLQNFHRYNQSVCQFAKASIGLFANQNEMKSSN